tara:strand:- start:25736 stop:26893 length:1158 start_codon:yes stop_codon:yes gene_type:complete
MFRPDQMGVYIHWPFCESRCPYCDFNAHVREGLDQAQWVEAYVQALQHYAQRIPDRQVVSIFFGGGTPSLMEPQTVARIIDTVQSLWPVANDLEITLEANPTSVENDKLIAFKEAGVNRISLGVQALNDAYLKFFGRGHSVDDALRAIELAKTHYARSSFDLIYARPDQTLDDWGRELEQAITLSNGHLSLYQLTIERNTPFYMRHSRGEFTIPDDVKGADFYHLTQDILEGAGLPSYEVSNHAKAGHECRHNLIYWHMADYIGVGAGAHGRFVQDNHKYASRDHAAPEIWLERVHKNGHGAHALEGLTQDDRFHEALMMGLRLREGISIAQCETQSGLSFFDMVAQSKMDTARAEGWIIQEGDSIRLTREGMLRLNVLIPFILK